LENEVYHSAIENLYDMVGPTKNHQYKNRDEILPDIPRAVAFNFEGSGLYRKYEDIGKLKQAEKFLDSLLYKDYKKRLPK